MVKQNVRKVITMVLVVCLMVGYGYAGFSVPFAAAGHSAKGVSCGAVSAEGWSNSRLVRVEGAENVEPETKVYRKQLAVEAERESEPSEMAVEDKTETQILPEVKAADKTASKNTKSGSSVRGNSKGFAKIYKSMTEYGKMAESEAAWLWKQQLSNGAFAFYNETNGSVYINPYFSEIVAIALINYDDSMDAKKKIEMYFDWHMSHINSAESDYNGVAGTIYDYDVQVVNSQVVSEKSRGVYDSTDSYSALFVKALADYVKVYKDAAYIEAHASQIKEIVNVMFATMSPNGYTYAKPDYHIIYLMDNAEVYAGLKAAQYIYANVIADADMQTKVNKAVVFYEENFNKHWWKGDHYATVLNPDYSEYTGYDFSWDMFYPCATAQMFPLMYGIIDADSDYAKTMYKGLCGAWNWQDMDYVTKGVDTFYWGSFAYLGGIMGDDERLASYMKKYNEVVDAGRPYPLYSAESAMVLMGCMTMLDVLENRVTK